MSTPSRIHHVAIIGGGFSGVMTAVNLARLAKEPMRLTLIQAGALGRGVAYSTTRPEHLLNVAARNMSAFPDLPDHLLQWLRTRMDFDAVPDRELREKFIPRQIYGDYLRSLLLHYLEVPNGLTSVQVELIHDEAVDVETQPQGACLHFRHGPSILADKIVLACGNETPASLPGAESLTEHPAWVANPWQAWHRQLPAQGGSVILLGTGLTAVDAVLTLRTLGWQGVIHAVSRHGWLPQSHFRGIDYPDFPPADEDLSRLGLEGLTHLMETHCAHLRERGANPAIIVDRLRPHTQRIWEGFSTEEKTEFIRKQAARWNVLRHRIAPEIHAQLTSAQLTGQLQVHAATVTLLESHGNQIQVHTTTDHCLTGDLVVNATGPQTRFTRTSSPLLQNLLQRGLIRPDALDMGVAVNVDHTAVTPSGERSHLLLALGPLLRGTLWETVAVPELRGQAKRVAETLLGLSSQTIESPITMEYMI